MATTTKKKPAKASSKKQTELQLNDLIQNEISRLSELQSIDTKTLRDFAQFVIDNHKKKSKPPAKVKPLTLTQIKQAAYQHFGVSTTAELKKSGFFQMATDGMGKLDLTKKEGWEQLYRKFIGVLPGEDSETGYGCINGINIFKYDLPWRIFGLDPKTAQVEAIKSAYRNLSKIYHPDNQETGDAKVFHRLTVFYNSLTESF